LILTAEFCGERVRIRADRAADYSMVLAARLANRSLLWSLIVIEPSTEDATSLVDNHSESSAIASV